MLITVTAKVEKLKQLGQRLQEIIAKKPTQEFDREWDNNLICPENFISFAYTIHYRETQTKLSLAPTGAVSILRHPNKTINS